MITSVKKDYANQYSNLYETVSELLRTHDNEGHEVPYGDETAVKGFVPLTASSQEEIKESKTPIGLKLTPETYQMGRYYVKSASGKFEISNDQDFDSTATYYESDTISSLDELFAYIRNIAIIDKKYTRLPLDEPAFEIDLNARTINIPADFAKNGVSVQGDEIAEVLYFESRRFFDATDLGDDHYQIFIEWENADGETGVSAPWIHDIESKPGFIIFGWPLDSAITKKAGSVKFAVRFYRMDGNSTIYSLATQPATITIKPTLDYDINTIINRDEIDNKEQHILDRFVNSKLNNGATQAEDPHFIATIPVDALPVYFVLGGLDNNEYSVQATTDDGGQLTYFWKKNALFPRGYDKDTNLHGYSLEQIRELYPLGDNPTETDYAANPAHFGNDSLPFESTVVFVKTEDIAPQSNKAYYIKNESSVTGYSIYSEKTFESAIENGLDIYEKCSMAVINSVGTYQVIASNRVRNSVAETKSQIMTVEYPEKPMFIGSSIEFASEKIGTYEATGRPIDIYSVNNGRYKVGDEKVISVTAIAPVQGINSKGQDTYQGELTYQWYKAPLTATAFALTDKNPTTQFEILEGETEASLQITSDGYYRVLVTNNLNDTKDSITSGIIRATNPASIPVVKVWTKKDEEGAILVEEDDYQVNMNQHIVIQADIDVEANEVRIEDAEDEIGSIYGVDKIKYQWYKYSAPANDVELREALEASINGEFGVGERAATDFANSVLIANANSSSFKPYAVGRYFCKVTNVYNNNESYICSPICTAAD